jgi:hypothetical protein
MVFAIRTNHTAITVQWFEDSLATATPMRDESKVFGNLDFFDKITDGTNKFGFKNQSHKFFSI